MPINQAVTPLRMIFWGALLCVLDLTFSVTSNGPAETGFRFDILNDFVGMILILVGVVRLARFDLDASYRAAMRFILVCAVLNAVEAFMGHFIFPRPPVVSILSTLLGLASLVAIVLFCTSMRQLATHFALAQSAASWQTTLVLVVILWVIPLGLLYLAGLGAHVAGRSFHWDIGALIIPILLVFLIPLIHFFVSTSRMRYEAEQVGDADAT